MRKGTCAHENPASQIMVLSINVFTALSLSHFALFLWFLGYLGTRALTDIYQFLMLSKEGKDNSVAMCSAFVVEKFIFFCGTNLVEIRDFFKQ